MEYFSRMNTASSYTQMTPLETNLLKLSSLLEQNNFVNEVFKGLALYTANNLENTERASKKLKHTLEETKRDIIRQVLRTAAPLIFSFGDFYQLSFNRKQRKISSLLTCLLKWKVFVLFCFFLLVPETLFFQTKPAESCLLSSFGHNDFGSRKCWPSL